MSTMFGGDNDAEALIPDEQVFDELDRRVREILKKQSSPKMQSEMERQARFFDTRFGES